MRNLYDLHGSTFNAVIAMNYKNGIFEGLDEAK